MAVCYLLGSAVSHAGQLFEGFDFIKTQMLYKQQSPQLPAG
jgi:hypothetical protein